MPKERESPEGGSFALRVITRDESTRRFRDDVERVRGLLRLAAGRMDLVQAKAAKAALGGQRLMRMRCDLPAIPADPLDSSKPSDLYCWILTIGTLLRHLGTPTAAVLLCRLMPAAKSARSSWETVALRCEMTIPEVKALFRAGIPAFLRMIDDRKITEQYRDQPMETQT